MNKTQDMLEFEKFLRNNFPGQFSVKTTTFYSIETNKAIGPGYEYDDTRGAFDIWKYTKEHGHE